MNTSCLFLHNMYVSYSLRCFGNCPQEYVVCSDYGSCRRLRDTQDDDIADEGEILEDARAGVVDAADGAEEGGEAEATGDADVVD